MSGECFPLKNFAALILRPSGKLETKGDLEKPHPFQVCFRFHSTPKSHRKQNDSEVNIRDKNNTLSNQSRLANAGNAY